MPWRLIIGIAIFAVFLVFVAFNIENRCDISFGFTKIENVPVFFTIFTSFAMGLLCSLPLIFHIRHKKAQVSQTGKKPKKDTQLIKNDDDYHIPAESETSEKIKKDAVEAKKRFFLKRRGGNNG
ncbi:MAG: hypothetical protein FWC06_03380 [Treponema sp.]|nr:hypothetical protein [Treponema sp.]